MPNLPFIGSTKIPNHSSRSTLCRRSQILLLLGGLTCISITGCLRQQPSDTPRGIALSPQQAIIEHSAIALNQLRTGKHHAQFEANLKHAKAVLVFPRVVKASFVFGGEGGNGVLIARKADGTWSDPAFYSIGAPSIGVQIGYQEATVALFVMDDTTLLRMLETNVEVGTNSGVSLERSGQTDTMQGEILTKSIHFIVDADGAYAGLSLNGYVIMARPKHTQAYYGSGVTAHHLLFGRSTLEPNTNILRQTLAMTSPCHLEESLEPAYPEPSSVLEVRGMS